MPRPGIRYPALPEGYRWGNWPNGVGDGNEARDFLRYADGSVVLASHFDVRARAIYTPATHHFRPLRPCFPAHLGFWSYIQDRIDFFLATACLPFGDYKVVDELSEGSR